jgi:hypothetical protein
METFEPTRQFDFTQVYLDTPQPVQGGTFFTKLYNADKKPLYIQMPKCVSKQGVVTTKRSTYCDLLYEKNDHESLIEWILALEEHCQKNIYEKSDVWFHNDFTLEDIETLMSPVYRLYNAGKKLLVRTYIDVGREKKQQKCIVYDEREVQVDMSRITPHTSVIPLIMIEGVKFSSKSFDIVLKLIQVMILDDEIETVQNCLIRRTHSQQSPQPSTIADQPKETTMVEAEPTILDDDTVTNEGDNLEILTNAPDQENRENCESEFSQNITMVVSEEENQSEQGVSPNQHEDADKNDEIKDDKDEIDNHDKNVDENVDKNVNEIVDKNVNVVENVNENVDENHDDTNMESTTRSSLEEQNIPETLENLELAEIADDDLKVSEGEPITLRKPNDIYYEIYKSAKQKANDMRRAAVEAYLETKEIKSKYMLQDIDDSDDESLESEFEEP